MEKDDLVFRKLQKHMDRMPVGFPEHESGADINMLKTLFSVEEAKVALELSMLPETIDRIYPRIKSLGYTKEQAEDMLNSMLKKRLVMGGEVHPKKGGKIQYSTAAWIIGMFEWQVGQLPAEIVPYLLDYINGTFDEVFFKKDRPVQMRTIPIGKSIEAKNHTATYDDVRKIIAETPGQIVIVNCVCRELRDKEGNPCKLSDERETCIYLRNAAKWALDNGIGRVLEKDEVLATLDRFEKIGYVLQPDNNREPWFVCCCCGCCCGVLTMLKHFPKPVERYHSNYFAVVDSEKCDGSGTCMSRCQMGAIVVKNNKAVVNLDRCIGCGLCVSTCKNGAVELQKYDKVTVPPKNHDLLYQQILLKKIGPVRMAGVIAKYMMGFKV